MADNTIIQQGSFISEGEGVILPIRSDLDWMNVINMTEAAAANASHGVSYEWRRGFAANDGLVTLRNAAATAVNVSTSDALNVGGFTLIDSSVNNPGAPIAITNISNGGLVLTANTAGLSIGSIVRLSNVTVAPQLAGLDFRVTAINPGVSFSIPVPVGFVGGATTGSYRIIPYFPLFYPRNRTVINVTQDLSGVALVSTTVDHGFTAGQQVQFYIPVVTATAFGMTQLSGFNSRPNQVVPLTATVTSVVNVLQFRISIDTSGFTAFAFPTAASTRFSPAQVIPVGEVAADPYANILDDATLNTGVIGIGLAAGITSPAGSDGDLVYWVAGKSFSVS